MHVQYIVCWLDRPRLGEQMKYCMDHPEEVSKLAKVKAQVSEVKGIMMENIDKAIDRGQQIDVLVSRTEQLHDQAGISVSFIKARNLQIKG
jgi:hypothetical protein